MYKRILSLDGGGIRGLISARILQEIEQRTNRRISELFDLIVGTSTGGILAVGLTAPQTKNNAGPYTAEKMAELYEKRGKDIFSRSLWKGVTSMGGLSDERYSANKLESILHDMFDDAELKDTTPDIIVTAYDIEQRSPYLFKTSHAKKGTGGRNHLLRHVARATSAAPTYFEPFLLDRQQWKGEGDYRRALVDGGVFANNPSMIALSEALSSGTALEEILLCAIGTGVNDREIPYEEAKGWGLVGWAKPILSVMMDGMADSAHYHARQLLPEDTAEPGQQRYFRFDTRLEKALDDLDAAHQANINALQREADRIIQSQKTALNRLIGLLD